MICGATGFIGTNLVHDFAKTGKYKVIGVCHHTTPESRRLERLDVEWVKADLTHAEDVNRVLKGADIVIQAAATTSGSKDIVEKPYLHVTDNAVMNSHILRACQDEGVKHLIFFSCTVMYPSSSTPVKESGFTGEVTDKYFGVGWTKVYIERMCEFYARLGQTRFTVIRHTNIYGPHDKFDLVKSHVFGATVAKVMQAQDPKIIVWGDGSEKRDLLYVDDLMDFVHKAIVHQSTPYELVNVGSGQAISIKDLVQSIIDASNKKLFIEFDTSKPTIPFELSVNIDHARKHFDWSPKTSLEERIRKSLEWYDSTYSARIT